MLTLESFGIIAEIVGSVGVIVSLVYLALQIREQTVQSEHSYHQTAIKEFVQTYCDIRNSERKAELYVKALGDYAGLTVQERTELDSVMMNLVGGYNKIQRLVGSGHLDRHEFDAMEHLMARIVKSPGINEWWNIEKVEYPAPVRDGIDAALVKYADSRSEYEKWVLRYNKA